MREPSKPLLNGRRILFVVPPARFDEGEFYQSWQLLSEEGAWLGAASDSPTGVAIGESGAPVRTAMLDEIDPASWDAILLIDGKEEPGETVSRAGRLIAGALALDRTIAGFGKAGGELHASGIPVVRGGRSLSRFLAEVAVRVARRPSSGEPAEPVRQR